MSLKFELMIAQAAAVDAQCRGRTKRALQRGARTAVQEIKRYARSELSGRSWRGSASDDVGTGGTAKCSLAMKVGLRTYATECCTF